MAEEIVLGNLKIKLRLDDGTLDADIKNAEKKMDAFGKKAAAAGKAIGIGIAAIVAGVSGAIALALNRADALSKAAQKIGVGVSELSRLEYAGRLADVSLDQLTTSIRFLNKNMSESAEGSKAAQNAFTDLDVAVKNADGSFRSTNEVFGDLADRFANMEEGPRKSALAMQVFGRAGADLIPLLNEGKAGLKKLGDEAARLGLVLDTETAAKAERVNDTFTRLWAGVQGLATRVAVALLPQLEKLSDVIESKAFSDTMTGWANTAIAAINGVVQAIIGLTNMFNAFMSNLNSKIGDTFAPIEQRAEATLRRQVENSYRILATNQPGTEGYDKVVAQLHEEELALQKVVTLRLQHKDLVGGGASFGELSGFLQGGDSGAPFVPDSSGADTSSQDALDKKLETLRDSLKSEAMVQMDAFSEQQKQLENFLEVGMITKQDYDNLVQQSEVDHWKKMKDIRESGMSDLEKFTAMSWDNQAKTVFSELENITSGVKDQNDIMFNINKGAAVANAVINTYQGISKSLSAYPMPLAGIMAGIHAAAGFAQVSSILATTRNTTTGSAKGLSGAAGAADGANTQAAAQPQSNVQYVRGINPGDLFTGSSLKSLAEGLLQYQKDGGQVVFEE